ARPLIGGSADDQLSTSTNRTSAVDIHRTLAAYARQVPEWRVAPQGLECDMAMKLVDPDRPVLHCLLEKADRGSPIAHGGRKPRPGESNGAASTHIRSTHRIGDVREALELRPRRRRVIGLRLGHAEGGEKHGLVWRLPHERACQSLGLGCAVEPNQDTCMKILHVGRRRGIGWSRCVPLYCALPHLSRCAGMAMHHELACGQVERLVVPPTDLSWCSTGTIHFGFDRIHLTEPC